MVTATLTKKGGEVSMDKSFDYLCSLLRNGVYTLTIARRSRQRSLPQNALMWMWLQCIEEATGTPKADIHDYYKSKFLSRVIVLDGKEWSVVGSTKELTSSQMTEYLTRIQADAATELGIDLPMPQDRHFNEFVSEYESILHN